MSAPGILTLLVIGVAVIATSRQESGAIIVRLGGIFAVLAGGFTMFMGMMTMGGDTDQVDAIASLVMAGSAGFGAVSLLLNELNSRTNALLLCLPLAVHTALSFVLGAG